MMTIHRVTFRLNDADPVHRAILDEMNSHDPGAWRGDYLRSLLITGFILKSRAGGVPGQAVPDGLVRDIAPMQSRSKKAVTTHLDSATIDGNGAVPPMSPDIAHTESAAGSGTEAMGAKIAARNSVLRGFKSLAGKD